MRGLLKPSGRSQSIDFFFATMIWAIGQMRNFLQWEHTLSNPPNTPGQLFWPLFIRARLLAFAARNLWPKLDFDGLHKVNFPLVCLHCTKLPGHVTLLLLRTWLNMWITSRRFFKGTHSRCVFGCSSPDSLSHYSHCPLLSVFGISQQCYVDHGIRKSLVWSAARGNLYNVARQSKQFSLLQNVGRSLEVLNGALQAFNLGAGKPIICYLVSADDFTKGIDVFFSSPRPPIVPSPSQEFGAFGGAAEDSP